jgi:hypothetical protein
MDQSADNLHCSCKSLKGQKSDILDTLPQIRRLLMQKLYTLLQTPKREANSQHLHQPAL